MTAYYNYSTRDYMVGIDPAADGCDVGVTMGDGMMGRVPHVPPTTVAEWVAQTRETGILNFDQLLDIGKQADRLRGLVESVRSIIGEPGIFLDVSAMKLVEEVRDARAHVAELCSAIETQSPSVTNEFVENARKRARDFLESMGKL